MFNASDVRILRDLGKRVRDIASLPVQEQRIALWKRHNDLEPGRPMLLVFPEGAWRELMPVETFACEGEEARGIERMLRQRIYYHEHLNDDTVVHAYLDVPKVVTNSGWGLEPKRIESPEYLGAWKFDPIVFEPADMKKMRYPIISHDEKATATRYEAVRDALGDILTVRVRGIATVSWHLMAAWTKLRGLEQVMMDMVEAPGFVHDAMRFLTEGYKGMLRQYVEQNLLELNNNYTYHNSGGNGWTDKLPTPGFDGKHVRLQDMWGSAESQELAEVSPAMHAEFALKYEKELLVPFALTGYGCCEALHHKLDDVLTIPHIRRISMSPWADVRVAAQKLGRKAIFSWKPKPAMLVGSYNEQYIRAYLREALAAMRGCVCEIILKDTHTVENRPERMHRWLEIAREEIDRMA